MAVKRFYFWNCHNCRLDLKQFYELIRVKCKIKRVINSKLAFGNVDVARRSPSG